MTADVSQSCHIFASIEDWFARCSTPLLGKCVYSSHPTIDQEVEAALGGISMDQILAQAPQNEQAAASDQPYDGARKGKVISIGSDDVFIDLGGKSQGVAPLSQFTEVKIGDEFEFNV